jgi:hypothetical protein
MHGIPAESGGAGACQANVRLGYSLCAQENIFYLEKYF